jgi:hypothetical protein
MVRDRRRGWHRLFTRFLDVSMARGMGRMTHAGST